MAATVHDWRIDFMQAHPQLFEIMQDEPELTFGSPNCQEGWRDVLERLCARIEAALQEGETFEFVRIKQKMGIIRVDWDGDVSDETRIRIVDAVNLAVARSACTCEVCGAGARLYVSRGWLVTACTEHAAGDPVPVKPGFENIHFLRRKPGAPDKYHARYDRETDSLTEVSPPSPDSED
jgi:hypothetical protein